MKPQATPAVACIELFDFMLDVINSLTVVEDHGKSRAELESLPHVEIRNHWNDPALVVFKVLDQEVTLRATEVIQATHNATNTAKYG